MIVGEPIDIRKQFGDKIGMKDVDQISKYLFDKENELKEIYRKLEQEKEKK